VHILSLPKGVIRTVPRRIFYICLVSLFAFVVCTRAFVIGLNTGLGGARVKMSVNTVHACLALCTKLTCMEYQCCTQCCCCCFPHPRTLKDTYSNTPYNVKM